MAQMLTRTCDLRGVALIFLTSVSSTWKMPALLLIITSISTGTVPLQGSMRTSSIAKAIYFWSETFAAFWGFPAIE